ncbi:hypothetical protein AB0J74_33335 [Asanoa sp. NPDC049573]|uniref:LppU/SCO3897 family protein n=1 Tax=Asanoa sp. NPDC049573 TaxID=3155396 RepID=UPI00343F4316
MSDQTMNPTAAQPADEIAAVPKPLTGEVGARRERQVAVRRGLIAVGAVVALVVAGTVWTATIGGGIAAQDGDCLVGQDGEAMTVVGCGDADAAWKVAGRVEGVRQADFNAAGGDYAGCGGHPTATAWYWSGTEGGTGYVLCLEPVK